ncbi:uncharacterized protein YhfF [Microbacterium resistens]|uniref:Uncharacterized protein YhfF n=1 Tax=Microbacterium resistens TaxID=156977 RepID=A0ABU1SGZ7_9MICO|nr:ASCH domain-containing protein [Microbacterium resistens]MDR6868875.1 uncharacterized protein YhfF [Microbacterium resistens]
MTPLDAAEGQQRPRDLDQTLPEDQGHAIDRDQDQDQSQDQNRDQTQNRGSDPALIEGFWERARAAVPTLPADLPEVWAFGATRAQADDLLALVLDGTKTGTASSLWDLEAAGERLPEPGDPSIVLDGEGLPRAVIITTAVRVTPFGAVDEEHARAEGEGDLTLRAWREIHERFWRTHAESERGFAPDMPVVCERFVLAYAEPAAEER